ncbi:MAG: beta-lactamase domain protein [Gemmatimonadetes bacterium]|nr:beta-lactamase domain protein [Gemmatimonadota bacterium]
MTVPAALGVMLSLHAMHAAFAQQPPASQTQVVILGTGNPAPNPDRMGPSLAIIVRGTPYLVDAGTGVVRRASAASRKGVKGLAMKNLSRVFLTHLHSDHTIGLPDLMSTPWIMGRTDPLEVYGPPGTSAMMEHLFQAYSADNDIRINGLEKGNATGNAVHPHEIAPGVIYQDSNVKVTAFLVKHGSWPAAFGYRFDTPDRSIVVSGDASPSESVVEACHGCDVLVHEVYTEAGYRTSTAAWQDYSRQFHTSAPQLGELATRARPKLLLLFHQMYFGGPKDTDAGLMKEMHAAYRGKVVSARDLGIY